MLPDCNHKNSKKTNNYCPSCNAVWRYNNDPKYRTSSLSYNHNRSQESQWKRYLKYKYNSTVEEIDKLRQYQDNQCALCKKDFALIKKSTTDHDHKTNMIRGILCSKCNTSLGGFSDSVEMLQKAIEYITNPPFKRMKENADPDSEEASTY